MANGRKLVPVDPDRGRVIAWRAFEVHARVYGLVNLFLVMIYVVTDFGGYFWPMWPIMGWGLALGMQAMATYSRRSSSS